MAPQSGLALATLQQKAVIRLVDDDESVLRALSIFLRMAGWDTRSYVSGKAFLEEPGDEPGCVILDIRMPELTGIEVQEEMNRKKLALPIIFLSAHGDLELAVEAVRRGAKTFLEKPPKSEKLLDAVEEAARDDFERHRLLAYLRELEASWGELTASEADVANLVAKGLQNSVIAEVLGLTERTVRSNRTRIFEKLDVQNAVEVAELVSEIRSLREKLNL
ncbi:MAG: response regulator [Sutterellaceae bacterium]|nr:response regulator [Sutterellaceae bacterium]MDD7442311.1 response regulator [Sutterellaceae bacterium]MDY2868363.1 response regulator [Mesosutterella sp.]